MSMHFRSKANVGFDLQTLDFTRDPTVLENYSAFFAANGDNKPEPLQRWRHLHNPAGQTFAVVALEEGHADWAGLYVTSPVVFDAGGQTILGTQSLDTLTGASYRGHGLFPRLAEEVYRYSESRGARFVYGFPNAASAPGFFGRLNWVNLDPVPFLIKPLRASYFFSKLLAALGFPSSPSNGTNRSLEPRSSRLLHDVIQIHRFDDRATRLWNEIASINKRIAVRRDAKYLNWRLFDCPNTNYCVLALVGEEQLHGYVAFALASKHGGTIGYILELLSSPSNPSAGKILLKHAVKVLRDNGADALLAWCFPHSPNYAHYRRHGFWPLPERLRPVALHFGVRGFDSQLQPLLVQRNHWYLSYLDSDTV